MEETKPVIISTPKSATKLLWATLHGILLFAGLWLLNNTSYSTIADEALLANINSLNQVIHKKTATPSFVFINVSKDIVLLNDPEEYGNIAITDRSKLASFFNLLAENHNHHQFVFCDVFFQYHSEEDSSLQASIHRCRNILFPEHLENDSLIKPCLNIPTALATYETYTGKFSRFKLVYSDSIKTVPQYLHELFDEQNASSVAASLSAISPDYEIRPADVFTDRKYPYYNLGELLMLSGDSSFYSTFLNNKFIVLGNFDTDIHSTPAGKVQGPLILINTWLTLRNGKNTASIWWALFMIAGLSFMSYVLFYGKIDPPKLKHPWLYLFLNGFINKYFSFFGIAVLMVFISDLLFSVQTNIATILTYVLFVNFSISFYKQHFKKKEHEEA